MSKKKSTKYIKKALKAKSKKARAKFLRKAFRENARPTPLFDGPKHSDTPKQPLRPNEYVGKLDDYLRQCRAYNPNPDDMRNYFGEELPDEGIIAYILNKTGKKIIVNLKTVDALGEKNNINFTIDFDGDVTLEFDCVKNADLSVGMNISTYGCIQKIVEALTRDEVITSFMRVNNINVTVALVIARAITCAAYRVKVGTPAPDSSLATIEDDSNSNSISRNWTYASRVTSVSVYLEEPAEETEPDNGEDDECHCCECIETCEHECYCTQPATEETINDNAGEGDDNGEGNE